MLLSALLRRALSNLISNAIWHTPPGCTIGVELAEEDDGWASIAVKNAGLGIPPQALPHVFERFFRADPARRGSDRGSGLGLAIVRTIMQLHGGAATAVNVAGVETTLLLRFPGRPAAGGAATATMQPQQPVGPLPSALP